MTPVQATSVAPQRYPDPLELSIIIPAFNEERRIGRTLACVHSYFAAQHGCLGLKDVEVIVVDDGSTDGTRQVVHSHATAFRSLRLVSNETNRGKGYSVQRGVREARGRVVLFTDADLSFSMADVGKLHATIAAGNDVAIGSRSVNPSLLKTPPPPIRRVAGVIFNRLARTVTGLPFRDTQCGLKAFMRDRCLILFEQQQLQGFGFDAELLFLARRHSLTTVEVPVRSSHDPDSKVRLIRDSLGMLWELLSIRWNGLLDRYPIPTELAADQRGGIYDECSSGRRRIRTGNSSVCRDSTVRIGD
jgi:glycosyltransferase involved in cell wall biosynthesis